MKKCRAFLTGIALGAIVAALVTPKTGKELQEELIVKASELNKKIKDFDIKDITFEDAKCAIKEKLDDAKQAIEEFDWNETKHKVQEKFDEVTERLAEVKRQITDPQTEEIYNIADLGDDDEIPTFGNFGRADDTVVPVTAYVADETVVKENVSIFGTFDAVDFNSNDNNEF